MPATPPSRLKQETHHRVHEFYTSLSYRVKTQRDREGKNVMGKEREEGEKREEMEEKEE